MSNKYNYEGHSIYDRGADYSRVFYVASVESTTDPYDGGRIKARIKGIDDTKTLDELPYAFPMLQKFFHVVPRIGETVFIFVPDTKNTNVDRVYVGPVISQPQFLNNDPHLYNSRSLMDTGIKTPEPAPSTIPENKGAYPTKNEVALQGRDNTDVIFKKNEIVIRAGKFVTNESDAAGAIPKFNKDNPAYIQLKYNVEIEKGDDKKAAKKGSVTNIVASKINLLTHDGGQPRFKLNDQNSMITDEDILRILETAHPLVFGDLLVDYLILQRKAFINHVHPYHGMKPLDLAGATDITEYLAFDLQRLLSKNIRIN